MKWVSAPLEAQPETSYSWCMDERNTDHISLAEHYDILTVEMYHSFNLINPFSTEDTFYAIMLRLHSKNDTFTQCWYGRPTEGQFSRH